MGSPVQGELRKKIGREGSRYGHNGVVSNPLGAWWEVLMSKRPRSDLDKAGKRNEVGKVNVVCVWCREFPSGRQVERQTAAFVILHTCMSTKP